MNARRTGQKPETPSPQPAKMLRRVVAVAFFMQMLDSTILNTALPARVAENALDGNGKTTQR